MASPNPFSKKIKWPSEKKDSMSATDFVPYISNLVNAFRKAPRPMAPKQIDPVTGTQISLASAKNDVEETTRAANLATSNLDAQTGAAIRVGNMGAKFRSLNDLNAKEAQMNAQIGQQTKMINANIDSQNSAMINQYHDDMVNSQIAQGRASSENLANAADKFIEQKAVKDSIKLDRDKTVIMSKMYNDGVYNRLTNKLAGDDVIIPGTPQQPTGKAFDKYKGMATQPTKYKVEPEVTLNDSTLNAMKKRLKQGRIYAAGGMMKVATDPDKPKTGRDDFYEASAKLSYYKDQLNTKLKSKNPEAFANYFKGLSDLRRSGKSADADKYVQETKYNEYLSPDEVRNTLGEEGYNRYLSSLGTVNQYNISQGKQPLYGSVEGENDIRALNYGRRFASLQLTPSLSVANIEKKTNYNRSYQYDPGTDKVNYTEAGDMKLKPDYLLRRNGGRMRRTIKPFA